MKTANHEQIKTLASEVSARWPDCDKGDGALYVMAREALESDPETTPEDVRDIAREAEADHAADLAAETSA